MNPVISADFPGGNVRVLGIAGDTVRLAPDLRETQRFWFFWRFRATFPTAGTWRFEFPDGNCVGTRGPAVRRAGERDWRWLSGDALHASDRVFEWTSAGPETVEFCQCIPYQGADFDAFAASFAGNPCITVSELCRSRAGRSVPLLRLREGEPAQAVLFTCRHHAQESMASFALEGLFRALASDEPWARAFRRSFEVLAVPLVDRDGVEDGTQGKFRTPHDHNRDYGAPGGHLYPECAAIDRLLDERRPAAVLDLHSPWIRGGTTNEQPYLVGIDLPHTHPVTDRFGALLERHCPPEAPYRAADTLAFGREWNTGVNYAEGMGLKRWAALKPFVRFSQTLEIPFANFREKTQTPDTVRAFGRGIAAALAEYFLSPAFGEDALVPPDAPPPPKPVELPPLAAAERARPR